ncbi:MAG: hypothetical protein JRC90_04705 [Deltaproteobacteria bacterium]|nr:hypothetical protein [Deltaproteobacteria bacterium]
MVRLFPEQVAVFTGIRRKDHATFEDYCRERWEFKTSYANYLVASTDVMENLTTIVVKPANEGQTRPLTKLEPELQKEAWQKAVDTAPDGKITARHEGKELLRAVGFVTDRSHFHNRK